MNSLKQLQDCGQSIWLDYIRRDLITSGEFQRLVEEDGVHGVTSNPTIFDKAIRREPPMTMHCACCSRRILTATPRRCSKVSKSRISRWLRTSCGLFTIKLRVRMALSALRSPRGWLMTPGKHRGSPAFVEGRKPAQPDGEDPLYRGRVFRRLRF